QRIHEDAVPLPIQLRFERLLRIVGRAIPACHHEEFLSTFHWNTLEANQIPTVQKPEIPQIPGPCKGSGTPISFWAYFKVGLPLTLITLAAGTAWLGRR